MCISIFLHLARFPFHWLDRWMGRRRIYAFILLMLFQPHSSMMTHNHKIVKLVPKRPPPSLLLRTFRVFFLHLFLFLHHFLIVNFWWWVHETEIHYSGILIKTARRTKWTNGLDDEMTEAERKRKKNAQEQNILRRLKFVSLRMSTNAKYYCFSLPTLGLSSAVLLLSLMPFLLLLSPMN